MLLQRRVYSVMQKALHVHSTVAPVENAPTVSRGPVGGVRRKGAERGLSRCCIVEVPSRLDYVSRLCLPRGRSVS